ncbi:17dace5b-b333-4dda-93f6-0bb821426f64 [Thermothielavioides terrestris]|nr:17dace5b-b333-4dda-93f6-0bb821426f64 [Thermothielavioides terrestris]
MSWEEAARRFRSHEPSTHSLARLAGPQLSPAPSHSRPAFTSDSREMDLDPPPTHHHAQPALNEARIRTPLPSGPRPEKPISVSQLPGFDSFRADLQGSADRMLANPFRSRYAHVSVLLVRWQDDEHPGARSAVQELAKTFHEDYNYVVQIKSIPTSPADSTKPWLWLSQVVRDFIADHNQRDCLKIFYYSGCSYLNGDRDTVLASSKHADPSLAIRWSHIQHSFEDARSDALLLMDCAYYPSYATVRRQGMLEVIAASAGEDHAELLGRGAFTRALTDQLRTRAIQPFKEPFSAAELHAKLLSLYPRMIQEQNPEREVLTRYPTPLSMQLSGVKALPSILLAPLRNGEAPSAPPGGTQISITFRLANDVFNMDSWAEWLRSMPEGITEARVDGPYRSTFQ